MHNTFSNDDLLTPLALTVIIDHKVRDPELSEYVVQAEGLLELLGSEKTLKPQDILAWFRDNEAILTARLKSAGKNTFVLKCLTRFQDNDAAIEAMYDAMLAISISDQEYHVQESELIKSAASLWGYSRPPFKVTDK
ncbi:MAG TPA: hypothetical protein ENJ46_04670 [Hellea balneolensis]|uniref:Co-chaperone DjlA N-terminal domain-containing protein n=1 Tax=Hellea balneolensis TaxID=287478 RepID=A0A7C3C1Z8_9PROT|nr:hypothetical protein [Hellea balneolensis]